MGSRVFITQFLKLCKYHHLVRTFVFLMPKVCYYPKKQVRIKNKMQACAGLQKFSKPISLHTKAIRTTTNTNLAPTLLSNEKNTR